MTTVAINIVRYNQPFELIERCLSAALRQDLQDFSVTLSENGSADSIENRVMAVFGGDSRFRYVNNGGNLGFSRAHNLFFRNSRAEFVMPLNPDTEMSVDYLTNVMRAFGDPRVAAAEGKMLKPGASPGTKGILDGTGMTISRARAARERGQLEPDEEQYDSVTDVFGVSGTAAIFRKSALEVVRYGETEYFDEDFFTYWEDLDLSWRLRLAGFSCAYVPDAIVFHSRFAGQTKRGFRRPLAMAKQVRTLPVRVVGWNWRNHLFAIIKNDFGWSFWRDAPSIVGRELSLFCFLLVVQPRFLGAVPGFFRLLPRILRKRAYIQSRSKVNSSKMSQWFGRSSARR